MTFERMREYPLALQVDTDLARLRQWSLLFGIPFPAHNAGTTGLLRLKPDGDGQRADFVLTGTATGIAEPQLEIERMQALKRAHLGAGRLDFRFAGEATLAADSLAGHFAPGLLIDAKAFSLETLVAEDARLVSQKSQSFSWSRRDGQWQLGPANYEIASDTIRLGDTTIRD
ncbi:MAG: hypothetical protein P8Z33_10140, partial [Gammaproteobacteria bacterium]